MQSIKYFRFLFILCLTGICFFGRERIWESMQRFFALRIDSPREEDSAFDEKDGEILDTEETETGGEGDLLPDTVEGPLDSMEEGPLHWEYTTVEEDYFDDALFIGDSRTVGLMEYSGLKEHADFYASTGLTVYKLFGAEIVPVEGSKDNISIEEALTEKQFSKIYLMVGINEMGTGTVDSFVAEYEKVVAHLQELQPDAIIYIQAIIRVSAERSAKGDYIHNEGINARNEGLSLLADDQKIFYLDVNPLICDEEGGLIQDYTFDGVHLKAKYIAIWKDFLMEHAVKFSE
ncbi:MAG: acylhydrolase [Lachnospiraceae bacterium]|nr:acylhydrolase [Lachnospiraceae bacterium]